jgi:WD40 repeat protein
MLASAIRELAASKKPERVAAAYFEKTIQIWDVDSQTRVHEFPTLFCSGANCLALAPDAGTIAAGFSTASGRVAAYDAQTGSQLWEQKVIYPRRMRFSPSGESILCTSDNRSIVRFDVHTGSTLEVIEGIEQHIEGPYGAGLVVPARERGNPFRLSSNGQIFSVSRLGFALSDAKFSPRSVCLTEAKGAVRCISCLDGSLEWAFDPGVDSQVLRLHYSSGTDTFWGVLQELDEKGPGSRYLVKFDSKTGSPEQVCELESWAEVFLDAKDLLVTSAGEIVALANGVRVGRLAFPQREYPDD